MKIVVGLSGGVDSAVAALLLKRAGHDVVGLFMKNWEDDDDGEYCSTREDLVDAVSVAEAIGIDVEAVNFAAEYRERVFAAFLAEYRAGRTPNPDVLCNAEIKFRAFLDHAMALGAERIATGHYARIEESAGRRVLLKGVDPAKDQSYFLHRLDQAQLARTLFPVGGLLKAQVRQIAREAGLPNHAKRDSTGICFIGERPFRAFLARYLPREPGPMVTPEGECLGEHQGLMYYTIGQRQGLGIGGRRAALGVPWYVAQKHPATNTLVVVQGREHRLLLKRSLCAGDASWIGGAPPAEGALDALAAKTRYRQADAACALRVDGPGAFGLDFAAPQWAVTPGQSAVLYRGEVCLGGGSSPRRSGRRTGRGERGARLESLRPRPQRPVLRAPLDLGQPEFQPEERAAAGDVAHRQLRTPHRAPRGHRARERRNAHLQLVALPRDPGRVLPRRLALALEKDGHPGVGDAVAQRLVAAHARPFDSRGRNQPRAGQCIQVLSDDAGVVQAFPVVEDQHRHLGKGVVARHRRVGIPCVLLQEFEGQALLGEHYAHLADERAGLRADELHGSSSLGRAGV